MVQNSASTASDHPVPHAGILPANLDDPRFADHTRSDWHAQWTTGSAFAADLTEPVDETRAFLTSPEGVLALATCVGTSPVGAKLGLGADVVIVDDVAFDLLDVQDH
jgi:hypothetical protein